MSNLLRRVQAVLSERNTLRGSGILFHTDSLIAFALFMLVQFCVAVTGTIIRIIWVLATAPFYRNSGAHRHRFQHREARRNVRFY